jgi:hypothetical protein
VFEPHVVTLHHLNYFVVPFWNQPGAGRGSHPCLQLVAESFALPRRFPQLRGLRKRLINFYYPKALHRSVIADVGITTPKQLARTLVRYSGYHPELQLSKLVIVQIPGSLPRSTAVHGVMES